MKILMIFPDVPSAVGTGGQVRAWHFLKAVTGVAQVIACLLPDAGSGQIDPDWAISRGLAVIQPPQGFRAGRRPRPGRARSLLRALRILVVPMRENGRALMIAGRANNVNRAQNCRGLRLTRGHSLYAAILRALAGVGRRTFRVDPPGMLVRIDAWQYILPEIREALHVEAPDVIWCEHSYLYPVAIDLRQEFPKARVICNAHNVEWVLHEGMARTMVPVIARKWVGIEASVMRIWEQRMMEQADGVVCCSGPDAARFRELSSLGRAEVSIIPNGVDTGYFQPAPPSDGPPCLLFAGTAGYPPNDDAVEWLVRDIFPLIRSEVPDCRLVLAGRNATQHWSKWQHTENGIELATDVPDMRPWFNRASVCVVPLLSGSGTRLKILEAMSSGRAVVSTTVGAEGIEGINGTHWCLADTAENFAKTVLGLLGDRDERHTMECAGRDLVLRSYAWDGLMKDISHLLAVPALMTSS